MDYEGLIKNSWALTKKDLGTWIAATLVFMFGSIFLITFGPLAYGYNFMAVKSLRSKEIRLKDIFEGFKLRNFVNSWILIIVSIIPYVLITFINSLLAYIVLFLFIYAMPLLILRGYGSIAACKESVRIAIDNPVETIIIVVFYMVLANIGFLALLVGSLITTPMCEILITGAAFELTGEDWANKDTIDASILLE